MALLSRSFVRKRVISLATTLSVTATSFALAEDPTSARSRRATVADANEQQFLFDNDLAMSNMNRGMLVKPTGDIDRDFVAMMIPHHQGAIDMAQAELKYGHNQELRRLAQNIVTQQQHEMSEMRLSIGELSPPQPGGAPVPPSSAGSTTSKPPTAINSMHMN
jgi:uncharacterized protein (DUF305 family)